MFWKNVYAWYAYVYIYIHFPDKRDHMSLSLRSHVQAVPKLLALAWAAPRWHAELAWRVTAKRILILRGKVKERIFRYGIVSLICCWKPKLGLSMLLHFPDFSPSNHKIHNHPKSFSYIHFWSRKVCVQHVSLLDRVLIVKSCFRLFKSHSNSFKLPLKPHVHPIKIPFQFQFSLIVFFKHRKSQKSHRKSHKNPIFISISIP